MGVALSTTAEEQTAAAWHIRRFLSNNFETTRLETDCRTGRCSFWKGLYRLSIKRHSMSTARQVRKQCPSSTCLGKGLVFESS